MWAGFACDEFDERNRAQSDFTVVVPSLEPVLVESAQNGHRVSFRHVQVALALRPEVKQHPPVHVSIRVLLGVGPGGEGGVSRGERGVSRGHPHRHPRSSTDGPCAILSRRLAPFSRACAVHYHVHVADGEDASLPVDLSLHPLVVNVTRQNHNLVIEEREFVRVLRYEREQRPAIRCHLRVIGPDAIHGVGSVPSVRLLKPSATSGSVTMVTVVVVILYELILDVLNVVFDGL